MTQADSFPTNHPDHAFFARIRSDLPSGVSDDKVAQALLDAKTHGGLASVAELDTVALKNGTIYVVGHVPGFRSITDANSPAPAMQDTLASLGQAQEQARAHGQQLQSGRNEPQAPQSGGPSGQFA